MRVTMPEHQFTKVSVIGDEDSTFGKCNGQDVPIGQARWIIRDKPNRVVTGRLKGEDQAGISALIQQKPHTGSVAPRLLAVRLERLWRAPTAAWA